jgi:hypothetical protein
VSWIWPKLRCDSERYKAVMADNTQPPVGAAALRPGSFLTYEQTLNEQPLPQSVAGIDGLQGLKYVKGKDKVLLRLGDVQLDKWK